jgi:hypothetical protein
MAPRIILIAAVVVAIALFVGFVLTVVMEGQSPTA